MSANIRIGLPQEKIVQFCHKWEITELALFGSVLREDFRPDSDVDVLVTFAADVKWSLLDIVQMQEELTSLLGRQVDLVEAAGLRNPFRRHAILTSREVVFAA